MLFFGKKEDSDAEETKSFPASMPYCYSEEMFERCPPRSSIDS